MKIVVEHDGKHYSFRLKIGYKNAIKRHPDDRIDRKFRRRVNNLNKAGFIVINTGTGYFIPDPRDPIDRMKYREYDRKEYSRELDIKKTRFGRRMSWFKECEKYGV